jgi:hypothetical protein
MRIGSDAALGVPDELPNPGWLQSSAGAFSVDGRADSRGEPIRSQH